MTSPAEIVPRQLPSIRGRQVAAKERRPAALAAIASCRLCAHDCGANRLTGPPGLCKAGADVTVFSAQTEVSDELELIPVFAIALAGCDLRCDFCITGRQSWDPRAGYAWSVSSLAARSFRAIDMGAASIMILGGEPTIHLPFVLALVAELPETARLVWKTNGHGSAQARDLLDGLFDVWVVDFKFGGDGCAARLAGTSRGYRSIVQENLIWASERVDLIVRHLLMPGHMECCWRPIARWLGTHLPGVKVNLRDGYWPAWKAGRHPELARANSVREGALALDIARECGLNLVK